MTGADVLNRWFALMIAQVLPGLLVIFGLSFHAPAVAHWLGVAATSSVSVGSVVLVLLASICASMMLNGARFVVFERVWPIARPDGQATDNTAARSNPGVELAYQDIVAQHYAYYQFYGSMAVAFPLF